MPLLREISRAGLLTIAILSATITHATPRTTTKTTLTPPPPHPTPTTTTPTTAPPQTPPTPFTLSRGTHPFTTKDITIPDPRRGKDLELRIRIPSAPPETDAPAAGWPLIVFSHGAGGSRDAFTDLLDFLATRGYASIAPTHADSIALRRRQGGEGGRQLLTPEGRARLRSSVDLRGRVDDCIFIIDNLPEIADIAAAATTTPADQQADNNKNKTDTNDKADKSAEDLSAQAQPPRPTFDPEKIAIAGHSAGAFTTQLCAGVRARAAGIGGRGLGFISIGDERFKAAIIISGQGTTSRLLGEDSWSKLDIPTLTIAGSLDGSPPNMGNETPESRQHPFTKSRGTAAGGPAAYLLYIEGATHSSYAGKRTSDLLGETPGTDVRQIQNAVAAASGLFLDAHLHDRPESLELLLSNRLDSTIPGRIRYEHK